jgi:cyclin C
MEFYLLTELECDLTIHHPYKTLLALCTKQSGDQLAGTDVEMGELTSTDNVDDIMASADGRLELDVPALQLAW